MTFVGKLNVVRESRSVRAGIDDGLFDTADAQFGRRGIKFVNTGDILFQRGVGRRSFYHKTHPEIFPERASEPLVRDLSDDLVEGRGTPSFFLRECSFIRYSFIFGILMSAFCGMPQNGMPFFGIRFFGIRASVTRRR